jgi:hypothetical protein
MQGKPSHAFLMSWKGKIEAVPFFFNGLGAIALFPVQKQK